MVAFVGSVIISILLLVPFFWYVKRRPVGSTLSWGEAMAAATYVFFGLFWPVAAAFGAIWLSVSYSSGVMPE